ncbi:sodium:solute symporter family protein [Psychromonas sp. L1A2]|uniref:sodium:solute symporter family protein n=1 Tax=Psychromonas sp. L1A2 TaxID=2686356 RepID=UPI00135AA0EF|nr:sodium:solute symporter family protein [Psychromonas sp. L1A2]
MSSSSMLITAITVGYLLLVLFVGICAKKGQKSTLENYVTGGRHMGFLVLFFIFGAEIFSAFAFLGAPGWSYSKGVPALYILSYLTLGVVVWWLMAPSIADAGRRKGFLTQAEYLHDRYPSKVLTIIIGIVSLGAMVPYLTIQISGAGLLFHSATGGEVPFWLGALAATAVVTIYVYVSGLSGIGWTNLMQGLMMICIAWYLGLTITHEFFGGVGEMFLQIKDNAPEYLTMPGAQGMGWGSFSTAILVSTLGIVMWPHIFMKFYSADSSKTLKRVFVFYPLYAYILVPVLFIGFAGILIFQDQPLEKADEVLLKIVVEQDIFSPWVIGVVLSGALAAAMSTAANLAHSSASILTRDIFYHLPVGSKMNDKQLLLMTKIGVVIVSLAAYGLALSKPDSLVALLLGAYGVIVQLLPMLIGALWWNQASTKGAVVGLAVGSALTLAFQLSDLSVPWGWNGGFFSLIINSIFFFVISKLSPAPQLRSKSLS